MKLEHFFFFPKKRGLCRDAIVCMCIHTYVLIHTYTWCNNKPYLWHLLGTTRTASMGLYDFSLKYKYSNCNLQYVTVFKNDFYSERTFTLFYWIYSSVVEILQNREKSWFFNYIFYLLIFWNWEAVKLFFLMLGFPCKPVLCLGIDVALNRFTLVSIMQPFCE